MVNRKENIDFLMLINMIFIFYFCFYLFIHIFLGNEDLYFTSIISGEKTVMFSNGTLIIKEITKTDEGLYKCNASNNVGTPLEATIALKVIGMRASHLKISSYFHLNLK